MDGVKDRAVRVGDVDGFPGLLREMQAGMFFDVSVSISLVILDSPGCFVC